MAGKKKKHEEKLSKDSSEESTGVREALREFQRSTAELFEEQTAAVEKQRLETLATVRSAVDSVSRSDESMRETASQLSSLRDYVARQQNLVKRFQDGYDWTVIRNFCRRIIRCIDDVEKRLASDSLQEDHRNDLELVRDQLVFALDGNGVEQFRPRTDTPYTGQERMAEVVGKDPPDGGEPGHISAVVQPGYLYYISEELQKLVRPARVRLYQRKPEGSDEGE